MNARAAALAVTLAACAPRPVPDPPCGVWTLDLATADRDGDGYAWCGELSEVDCDDGDADVHPGAPERCDGVDSDCDGALPAWEADVDADGRPVCLGDCDDADGLDAARDRDGDGWTRCMGDCDDADAQVHPAAPEVCDGVDSDCDGRMDTDELDGDGDGWPACADCDDADVRVAPGAPETCDRRDEDCDGEVDDGCR